MLYAHPGLIRGGGGGVGRSDAPSKPAKQARNSQRTVNAIPHELEMGAARCHETSPPEDHETDAHPMAGKRMQDVATACCVLPWPCRGRATPTKPQTEAWPTPFSHARNNETNAEAHARRQPHNPSTAARHECQGPGVIRTLQVLMQRNNSRMKRRSWRTGDGGGASNCETRCCAIPATSYNLS